MKKSDSITELAKALCAFQADVKNPANTAVNPFFKSKYAPLPDILNAMRPLLSKHGLSILQSPRGDENGVGVTTLLMHTSGEWVECCPLMMKADKNTAQGAGSAITYARRYALSAVLGISSEDDDDGNVASKNEYKDNSQHRSSANEQIAEAAQESIPEDALICHGCHADITKGVKTLSTRKYGKPLCNKCQKEAREIA